MNKHVIMQKLLNNEEVSDSLFRKIYQFLDIVDSNDVDKLVEIFKEIYPETSETSQENTDNNGEDVEIIGDQSSQDL